MGFDGIESDFTKYEIKLQKRIEKLEKKLNKIGKILYNDRTLDYKVYKKIKTITKYKKSK